MLACRRLLAPSDYAHDLPAELIARALEGRGNALATVTLHVGWGTFEPIREADVRDHRMHRERYVVRRASASCPETAPRAGADPA